MYNENFDQLIEQQRILGERLVRYNYPMNSPKLEEDIHVFKLNRTIVDGYRVCIYFSKADYGDHALEIVQIYGENSPFLPFCLVAKIGQKFLGSHHLSLTEWPKSNRKIYCWTVCVDKRGRPIQPPYKLESEICDFEGFKYAYMQPNQIYLI